MKRRTILRGATLLPFMTNFSNENSELIVNQELSSKKIIKPKRLKIGDTLGVIAPASALSEKVVTKRLSRRDRRTTLGGFALGVF
jgi:muramoyltetrapeptide carboxypeptidase